MNKKILIIDDDTSILEVIKIILEDKGYTTIALSSAAHIQNVIEKNEPDLILLDIWISGHNGSDIVKTLKKNTRFKSIPVILISANNDTQKIAQEAGADGFIAKPFDIDYLSEVVKTYTQKPSV